MFDFLALTPAEYAFLVAVTFVAGMVRGFAGFALSALVMSISVLILPPVALIPVCWTLEATASAIMVRGGWADADRRIAFGLVFGCALGTPIGLALTTSLPVQGSTFLALATIITLATLQLAKVRMPFLATRPGLYGSGVMAGVATGIASIGGMVVALYVLSQDRTPRNMRATLVLFLVTSSAFGLMWLLIYGLMSTQALLRGLSLAPPVALGVLVGQRMFSPRLEPYYKPFCLCLLLGLAAVSLMRTLAS